MKLNFLNSRRFKHGSMATLITVIFIAVVVIINVIASIVLDRLPTKIDLTDDNRFQITQDSIDYVKTIDTDVTIYICSTEDTFVASGTLLEQANEIINDYSKYNSKIKVRYVDLVTEPTFVQGYTDYTISANSIIIESENRIKVIASSDLYSVTTDSSTSTQSYWSDAEKVMTAAIMYVTDKEVTQAVVLTGHQETSITGFTSMLKDNNYEISEQNIVTEDINQDAALAIIYAPTTDYTTDELKKLDAFLDNNGQFGKNIVYIASRTQPDLPNLESFLAEWGVEIGDGIIYETDAKNVYLQNYFVMGLNYGSDTTTYTEDLRSPNLPYIAANARPVTPVFTEKDNRKTTVLLQTNDTTILVPNEVPEDFSVEAQEQQSFAVAVLGQRTKYDGTTPLVSSVLVFGSDAFFNETFTTSANYNNNEFSINVTNKVVGKENTLNIVSVSFSTEKLEVTMGQYITIAVVFMGIVPLACIVFGILVWVRRRNK